MFQPDNNILNELKELSPVLANVPTVNVFKVPEGYFNNITSQVLLLAHASDRMANGSQNTFKVPENYFDTLADSIMNRIKRESALSVEDETREISNLVSGIGNTNVYTVPHGYFDNIDEQVISLLSIEEEILSSNASKESGALLAVIGNKNVYTIPAGYFEDVADEVKQKITRPAKVISLYRKISFVKYAAAAVITGILGLSIISVMDKNNNVSGASAQTVTVMSEAKKIIQTNSFDKEMEDISDASIVAFLEDKGQNVEAALVASLADEKNLPEADDYLLNENALDEVLNTIDLNN